MAKQPLILLTLKSCRFLTTQGMTASLPTATVMFGTGLRNSGPGLALEGDEDAEEDGGLPPAAVAPAKARDAKKRAASEKGRITRCLYVS